MKKTTFENMIKNPPQGATHYRRFRKYVVFYKNVDNSFGSYCSLVWGQKIVHRSVFGLCGATF